ncbi:MAG: polyphosphate:AMP phosphotransferase [Chromatiales bacterium]
MFEGCKLGRSIGKEEFKEQVPALRTELLSAQRRLRKSRIPVILIMAGVEGAGKGQVVNRLNGWLDTRGVQTHAFWDETDEERQRPRYWRFWRAMPARGEIGILFSAWYQTPIECRMFDRWDDTQLDAELTRISALERMLTEDGALVVKFWFHMSESDQRGRLDELSRDDRSRWKMLPPKKKDFSEHYSRFEHVAERVIRQTDSGISPWYLIEATDKRYRDLTVGRTLLTILSTRLESPPPLCAEPPAHGPNPPASESATVTVLDQVDLSKTHDPNTYKEDLKTLQEELNELAWQAYKSERSTVLVFEGVDAGGKGGAIRRLTNAIDSRLYRTLPVAAPTDEEKAHHYLWRFWRHIPRAGRLTVYDRSWYGRVLVERVEGFASEPEWRRAYAEINGFEQQLAESGVVLLKFWLHISQDEQYERFKERERVPYKQHKITDEDWRNREKWGDYRIAVNEMVVRTSTEEAPWLLIPGNDKKLARLEVLRAVTSRLRDALKEPSQGRDGNPACAREPSAS